MKFSRFFGHFFCNMQKSWTYTWTHVEPLKSNEMCTNSYDTHGRFLWNRLSVALRISMWSKYTCTQMERPQVKEKLTILWCYAPQCSAAQPSICHANYLSAFKINVQTAQFNVGTAAVVHSQDTHWIPLVLFEKMFDCWYKQPSKRRAYSVSELEPICKSQWWLI